MRDPIRDMPGIVGIILATGATCAAITATSGIWSPWLLCAGGIVTGLWAARIINRK